ncbi:MAG: linked oxidase protein [Gemmatimonadetes bacterium]|nr:linked oxidase protein [Gemmatimonadota bacterium]
MSSSAEISALIADARARRMPLRLTGGGTWLDAGRPCDASETLSADTGVVTYEPGDLVLTVRAGTPFSEIQRVTNANDQWLTLDPFGVTTGTLGATVATGSWGPLASAFGVPRDHVLGCEFVTGAGDIVRAGGQVVKNVAGFDLVRLATGSWGTVGMLTEITVRVRAKPEEDCTLAIAAGSVGAVADWVRASVHTPLAAEFLSPALAQPLTGSADASLLVRLGGNSPLVAAARNAAAALGDSRVLPANVWSKLAGIEQPGAIVFRVSAMPARIAHVWARALELTEMFGGVAHATVSRGVVRCILPPGESKELPQMLAALSAEMTLIGERLPASLWPLATRARSTDTLARGVRHAFDPDSILNPGILGNT